MPCLYQDQAATSTPTITSIANLQINYFNILKLCLQAHCVQIILIKLNKKTYFTEGERETMTTDEKFDENETKIYKFFEYLLKWTFDKKLTIFTEADKDSLKSNPRSVNEMLKQALMPFLRNAALFFAHLTDLQPIVKITSRDEDFNANFSHLLDFLGLSKNLSDLLDMEKNSLKTLCDFWLSTVKSMPPAEVDYPLEINKLIELPNDYIDLITMSMSSNV